MKKSLARAVPALLTAFAVLAGGAQADGRRHVGSLAAVRNTRVIAPSFAKSSDVAVCRTSRNDAITIVGDFSTRAPVSPGIGKLMMARLDRHGRRIPLSGGLTWSALPMPGHNASLRGVSIDDSGAVVYAFRREFGPKHTPQIAVRRMTPRGTPDNRFAIHGTATWTIGGESEFSVASTSLTLLADGRVALSMQSGDNTKIALFYPRGTVDKTFGRLGRLTIANTHVYAIQSGRGGALLLSATPPPIAVPALEQTSIIKLTSDGAPELPFGVAGMQVLPAIPSAIQPALNVQLEARVVSERDDGRLLLLGWTADGVSYPVNTSYEFDEFDPAHPAGLVWRSTALGTKNEVGDAGVPDYRDLDVFQNDRTLIYVASGGTTGTNTIWNYATFEAATPGAPGVKAVLTRSDLRGLVPQSIAAGRDGSTVAVCGVPVAPQAKPVRLIIVRHWNI